jgi:hypothetical protein
MSDLDQHPGWQWCTAEGSRRFDLESGSKLTLREKIQWLEEMDLLAQRFEQAREANRLHKPIQADPESPT